MDVSPRGEEQARLAARVGAPLVAARAAAGLTMAELGRRAGVSAGTVGKLERGQTRPRRVTLQRLADALLPHDQGAAYAFAEQLATAAGPSLVADATLPVSIAREMVVEILYRAMVELGLDATDERVRTVVVEQIRAVGGVSEGEKPVTRPAYPQVEAVAPDPRSSANVAVELLIHVLQLLAELPPDQRVGDVENGLTVVALRLAVWRWEIHPAEALAMLAPVPDGPADGP